MPVLFISLLTAICTIIIVFIAFSIIDIAIVFLYKPFYHPLAIIVSFGIAGMFAAAISFEFAKRSFEPLKRTDTLSIVITQIITGLVSFFFLSKIDNREYEA